MPLLSNCNLKTTNNTINEYKYHAIFTLTLGSCRGISLKRDECHLYLTPCISVSGELVKVLNCMQIYGQFVLS